MRLNDIVKDNEIYISEDLWISMNSKYSKEWIKEFISDAIEQCEIPLPYKKIEESSAMKDFKSLSDFNARALLKKGTMFSRYSYECPLDLEYIDSSNIGSLASNYFHQKDRWLCDSINAPSPVRTWGEKRFRMTLLQCLWTLKFKQITAKELRSAIHLRKYVASQFRPSAAKAIYQHFNSKIILDFSSGWGDRLAAFHSCKDTEFYFGIDPNPRVHVNYKSQNDFYDTGKEVELIHNCAEDTEIPKNTFDTVFTSPPYFNIERYTGTYAKDPLQSWNRYKKLQNWLEQFLFITLEKSYEALKSGGVMAINISDVYSNHQINRICDPMNRFLKQLGLSYQGAMGLRLAKRPESKAQQEGIFVEPVWVYKKQ